MALEVDEGLPFLEGVVIVSLLPLLPTLPTLPDGDGVGERGDGVPVILKKENTTVFFVKNSCPRLLWLSPTVHSTFFKADNVGNGSKCLSTKGVLLIEWKKKKTIPGTAGDDCRCPLREGIRWVHEKNGYWFKPMLQALSWSEWAETNTSAAKTKQKRGKEERRWRGPCLSPCAFFAHICFSFPASRLTEGWKRPGIHLQSNVNVTRFFCCHMRTRSRQIRLSFIML